MILLFGQFVYCGKVLRLNPYKRRLRSDVTFVDVLRYTCMCWNFSVRYNMYLSTHVFFIIFVLLLIYYVKELRKYLSKTNGYVILKCNCYLLYMCKTCGSVSVVPKISVNFPM